MKTLVLFPKGSISAADKGRMAKEGFIAVEVDDPSKVVTAIPSAPLCTADDLLMAAMTGVNHGSAQAEKHQSAFSAALFARMKAREAKAEGAV